MLAGEVAAKVAALTETENDRHKMELSLNISRTELDKLTNSLKKAESALAVQSKATGQFEAALNKQQELNRKLQRTVDALTAQHSLLTNQITTANASIASHERAAQLTSLQIKSQETTLVATQAALQKARRDAGEVGRVMQASKDASNEAEELRRELLHLGSELLKEQGALATHEAEHVAKEKARSRREARSVDKAGEEVSLNSEEGASINTTLEMKVASLQRRLIAQKEATEKLEALVRLKEADIEKLERALAIRMESDAAQKEVVHLRTVLGAKEKAIRAARAEVEALQAEISSDGKKKNGQQSRENSMQQKLSSMHIEAS